MDIEIQIRTGKRRRLETGAIKWDEYKDERYLVTYSESEKGAIRESLFQVEKLLRKMLGVYDMQKGP